MQKCKCGETISDRKVSGLCGKCRMKICRKKYRDRLKKDHICFNCHEKVEPITHYPIRCKKCMEKK